MMPQLPSYLTELKSNVWYCPRESLSDAVAWCKANNVIIWAFDVKWGFGGGYKLRVRPRSLVQGMLFTVPVQKCASA